MEMLDQIVALRPRLALVLALNVIGGLLKRSPFPNWMIPMFLVLFSAVAWPVIAEKHDYAYTAEWVTYNVLIGILLGAASIGLHQLITRSFPFLFPQQNKVEKEED